MIRTIALVVSLLLSASVGAAEARMAFQSVTAPTGNWNSYVTTGPSNFSTDPLIDIDTGLDTGWALAGTVVGAVGDSASGMNSVGSGDAAWVDQATVSDELFFSTGTTIGYDMTISGLDTGKTYTIECFGSIDTTATRLSDFTIGGSTLTLETWDNTSNVARFSAVAPNGSGEIALTWRMNISSSGAAAMNAVRIIEDVGGGGLVQVNTLQDPSKGIGPHKSQQLGGVLD